MKYMGSKSKITKYIVPILQRIIDKNNIQVYYEPFVGGANVIDKIKCQKRIGSDANPFLTELLKARRDGLMTTLPESVSKEHYVEVREEYNRIKNNLTEAHKFKVWYIGAIGFLASYNGRFFDGGYSGCITEKTGRYRDFYKEAKNNLLSQDLSGIKFYNKDYSTPFSSKDKCLVYCDPPYQGTKQYNYSKDFDYEKFWAWVREISKNHIVVVSEQQAPEDFKVIWEQPVTRCIGNRTSEDVKTKSIIEKLFTINGELIA